MAQLNSHPISLSLRQRLFDAEKEFLDARDNPALEELGLKWDVLCGDFERALEQGVVDDATIDIARAVFWRVATLGESLLELQEKAGALDEEIDKVLAGMTLNDLPSPSINRTGTVKSPRLPMTSTTARAARRYRSAGPAHPSPLRDKALTSSRPPFIAPAYDWLLRNIHNPYPAREVSRSIADEIGSSPNAISRWFKSTRAYIGWDSLCKRRFAGQRGFAITAARRVFFPDTGQSSLPPDVTTDILAVKLKLDHLYSDEFDQGYTFPAVASQAGYQDSPSNISIEAVLTTFPFSSRPSSPSSIGSSSSRSSRVPSLVFSSSDYDSENGETFPQHSSLHDPEDEGVDISAAQGVGDRLPVLSSVDRTCLAPRRHKEVASHPSTLIRNPRKRRRSDAGVYPPSKRPNTATNTCTTRLQVVSVPGPQDTFTADVQSLLACQAFPQDEFGQVPGFDSETLSQYVSMSLPKDTYSGLMPLYTPEVAGLWANDGRPLSEIVRDAPSSTTLKSLPLPDIGPSNDSTYVTSIEQWDGQPPYLPEMATISTSEGRELPPIHWSSSSLAGALGPLSEKPKVPLESNTTLDELVGERRVVEASARMEAQDSESQTINPAFPDASLPSTSYDWSDPFGQALSSSISSRLEEADSNELQQLLDLLDLPPYKGTF